jgi:hypothetical protein
MLAVSGKITGIPKVISTRTVPPCFSGTEHHVRQTGVVAASSLIVFSVNLSGITGIVPEAIDEKTGSTGRTDQEGQRSETTVSGITIKLRI